MHPGLKGLFLFFLLSGFVKYCTESEISQTGAVGDEGLTDNTLFGSSEDEPPDNKLKAECVGKKKKTKTGKKVNEQEQPDLQDVCTTGSGCSTQRH